MNLQTLISSIPKINEGQRLILGIDGLSRSGKTTLTKELCEQFKTCNTFVFHIDDFIVERNKRYQTGQEEWYEYYFLQWDIKWIKDNLLAKIQVSKELTLPFYQEDFDTQIHKKIMIPETCLVIVEGVFLQRSEWRNYFDLLVYLDCPRETRFCRESPSTQGKVEKFKNRYWKAENYYIDTLNPEKQADIILRTI